ncbi:hypothetical protein [Vibrio marisflavi]|uniref:Phage protein n=1 Tax=Vibrio marisflavi CECT 7928 TaxID=634439 RepID=A0ABN8EB94_9VIBR|nr:hypothetical protein [Vibrio marisflavi]CAH0543058.1 hypothetical protein VMF7928_04381 [Vibrio marisflavi CECT 7928]
MTQEINYKLKATADGVETHDDVVSVIARVAEWLDTPEGEVWGSPAWGNNLAQFRHEPQSDTVAAAMENVIANKLPKDLSDVSISGIAITPNTIGGWVIELAISGIPQKLTQEINL